MTGIPFDRVMVFPQGVFSRQAMEALLRSGYLAAVNSVPLPIGREELLDASDYLRCNIMKYGNFPLFMRKLPESLIDFAFDLFLGKPIFLVIHNEYLKKGYDQLIDCIVKINSLTESIKWESVGSIIEKLVTKKPRDVDDTLNTDLSGFEINGFKENMRILIRRYAFEFRDKYLCKSDVLLNSALKIRNLIYYLSSICRSLR
jgi:hypothetical protein